MGQSKSGKSAKGRQHSAHQQKYARQRIRTTRNKRKARAAHLKNHPHDVCARRDIEIAEKI